MLSAEARFQQKQTQSLANTNIFFSSLNSSTVTTNFNQTARFHRTTFWILAHNAKFSGKKNLHDTAKTCVVFETQYFSFLVKTSNYLVDTKQNEATDSLSRMWKIKISLKLQLQTINREPLERKNLYGWENTTGFVANSHVSKQINCSKLMFVKEKTHTLNCLFTVKANFLKPFKTAPAIHASTNYKGLLNFYGSLKPLRKCLSNHFQRVERLQHDAANTHRGFSSSPARHSEHVINKKSQKPLGNVSSQDQRRRLDAGE